MSEIKVLICGFGQIGRMALRHFSKTPAIRVTGVVNRTPALIGQDAARIAGLDGAPPLPIYGRIADAPAADIVVLTTVSSAAACEETIYECLRRGMSVVTTCEELFFPRESNLEVRDRIDAEAKKQNKAVLATGINPGFLMDFLPLALSCASAEIGSVTVYRVQDASPRRMQFQKKIGAGLNLDEFESRKRQGTMRHVGLTESVEFIAAGIGWPLAKVTEEIVPVIAEADLNIPGAIPVEAGQARGVRQLGRGYLADGREVVTLDFLAAIGEPKSFDRVVIDGNPRIDSTIENGVNGDRGSCSMVASCVRRLAGSNLSGLLTMRDLPVAGGLPRA